MGSLLLCCLLLAVLNRAYGSETRQKIKEALADDYPIIGGLKYFILIAMAGSLAGYGAYIGGSLKECSVIALSSIIGLCAWRIPGIGRGFAVIEGHNTRNERELLVIDWIADRLTRNLNEYWHGGVWMSLKGLTLMPMFVGFSFLHPLAWVAGLLMMAQGLIYFAGGKLWREEALVLSELFTGMWVGTLATNVIKYSIGG